MLKGCAQEELKGWGYAQAGTGGFAQGLKGCAQDTRSARNPMTNARFAVSFRVTAAGDVPSRSAPGVGRTTEGAGAASAQETERRNYWS